MTTAALTSMRTAQRGNALRLSSSAIPARRGVNICRQSRSERDIRSVNAQLEFELPPILDACCGPRMMWFDKLDGRALFIDKRRETHPIDIGTPGTIGRSPIVVDPDVLADFTALPFPDQSFSLVVLDPPHIEREEAKGLLTRKYGILRGDWRHMLQVGFAECFRVLKPAGTLIFKWAETEFPLAEILALTPEKPLFGHRSGKLTHWCVFMKDGASPTSTPVREPK